MRGVWAVVFGLATMLVPAAAGARDPATALFADQEIIHVVIKGPIRRLIADRSAASRPADATLALQGDGSAPIPVTLSLRGVTRRKLATCAFPPLRVAFPQPVPDGSLFGGQKKLKLVTHCGEEPWFQQYVLLEYAAYRIYNLLTPLSFEARLAFIDYVEPDGRLTASRIGFFLENEKDVARRNGLREAEAGDRISRAQLKPRDAARQAVFEDMIGNLDWSMTAGAPGGGCCHNTKLIAEDGAKDGFIPVPYDFDAAGLVDTPYAAPPNGSDLPDVLTRRYGGYCMHNAEARAAAAEFRARRADILAMLDRTPQLEDGPRRKAAAYLNGFFQDIATDNAASTHLLNTCRPG